MANKKITELLSITGANLANADEFVVVDISDDETKSVTREEFFKNTPSISTTGTVTADGLTVANTGTTRLSVTNNTTGVEGLFGVDSTGLSISSTTAPQLAIGMASGTRFKVENTGNISFYEDTGTTPKFFWDASAERLGIGTSSPQSGLEVSATAVGAITVPLTVSNQDTSVTGTGVGIGFVVDGVANVIGAQIEAERTASAYHASALKFRTKDTSGGGLLERMRIDATGNVGIGTAVPRDLLNIFAGTGQVGTRFQNTATGTTAGDGSFVGLGVTGGATNSLNMWVYESADMVFGTNNTVRMRINSSGNSGIGTSSSTAKTNNSSSECV